MPFFITASIMCWAKDLIILFLCHFEVIMSYFAPVHVTGRSHHHCMHSTVLKYEFPSLSVRGRTLPAPPQFAFGIRFLITPLLVRREVGTVLRPSAFRISPRKWCENPKRMNTDKLRLMAAFSDRMNVLIHPPAA